MDKIIQNRKVNFTINDVDLLLDPIQISVYKEGLNYSWKTLRTKASSKIVNGNGVFHLKLNLIFTRSMFLEMHRLVCQMRNTPFVQIQNQFISDSVGKNKLAPAFFTVSSLQLIPRADSPYTIDMELDLRFFNHTPFESTLSYKEFLETQPVLKNSKNYSYSFDVFPRDSISQEYGIVEHEIVSKENSQLNTNRQAINVGSLLKRNLNPLNRTSRKLLAKNSKAFIRYSNYLQIKNLTECFGFSVEDLKNILGAEVNQRNVVSLCKLNEERKTNLINHKYVYGEYTTDYQVNPKPEDGSPDIFRGITISYQDYLRVDFSANENKVLRKHFYEKVKGVSDPIKRREIIANEKQRIFVTKNNLSKDEKSDLAEVMSKVKGLSGNDSLNIYTGRKGFNNIFYQSKILPGITYDGGTGAVITGFSCGFTNMFSSLPISGQAYPTHQYLGSSEPIYNINIVSRVDYTSENGLEKGYSRTVKAFEEMRHILQRNAKEFKVVPDSGYFSVDHFFTKLLGSRKTFSIDPITNKIENNFILRNFNVSTMEGSPGAQSLQFSFCETNNFAEEEMGGVYKLGDDLSVLDKVEKSFKGSTSKQSVRSRKAATSINYSLFNWNTKYFSSKPGYSGDFYYRYSEENLRNNITAEQDENAFEFCRDYLDYIQEGVNKEHGSKKVFIGSSVDYPGSGIRKSASRHYAGCAVDVVVEGVSPVDLMKTIWNIKVGESYIFQGANNRKIGLIGYYQSMNALWGGAEMKNRLLNNFFVHIDARKIVHRFDANGDRVTDEDNAQKTDTFEIVDSTGGDYAAFDVRNVKGLIREWRSVSLINYLSSDEPISVEEIDLNDASAEEAAEVEGEDLVQSDNTNDGPISLTSNISVFSPEFINRSEGISRVNITSGDFYPVPFITNESFENFVKVVNPSEEELRFVEQGDLQHYYDSKSDVLYIPDTDTNIALDATIIGVPKTKEKQPAKSKTEQLKSEFTKNRARIESEDAKTYVSMLDELYKLASLMLTEPELYSENPEQEKARIRQVLNDDRVEPMLFSAFCKFIQSQSGLTELALDGLMLIASSVTAGAVLVPAALGGGAAWSPGGHVGALIGATIGTTGALISLDSGLSYLDGKNMSLFGLSELIKDLKDKNVKYDSRIGKFKGEVVSKESRTFIKNLGDSDTVMQAFTGLANYVIAESPLLKSFSNNIVNLPQNTSLSLLLGTYKDVVKTVGEENYLLRGALSDTLFMGELKRVFEFYFGYPYSTSNIVGNEYDLSDLFEIKINSDGANVTFLKTRNSYIPSIDSSKERYRISALASDSGSKFPISNKTLEDNQERKLEYLLRVKEEILRGLSQIPEVQETVGITVEENLFNLIESNTYPDINLPANPANISNNADLHPAFYFYNNQEESPYREGYINPTLKENISKIVGKSFEFEKALKSGVFSGSASELTQLKSGNFEYEGYNNLDYILLDTGGERDNETGVTGSSGQTEISAVSNINNLKLEANLEKIRGFQGEFRDMFGSVKLKEKSLFENEEDYSAGDGKSKTKEEVIKDALDSTKGMLISKDNIKRAFPTFRMYLIEEDSVESGKISVYDDFYSFNGVKSFSVYEDRKLPTATATIQLQNISGVLDGTKPEVIRDIDIDQNLTPEEESRQQAMVESIVIRPGINIQLRAGYESNPNKLDVVFTGRITEVKNSSTGEVLEVVAQSFGTELISKKLGIQKGDPYRDKVFYNTHSLLGSLCLSEELKHFGRIKKGRRFDDITNRSPALENLTGKSDDEWYNFHVTNWLANFFENYGIYIAVGSVLVGGASNGFRYLSRGSNVPGWVTTTSGAITRTRNFAGSVPAKIGNAFNLSQLATRTQSANIFIQAINATARGTAFLARGAGNLSISLLKPFFTTFPSNVFNYLRNVGLGRYLKNIREARNLIASGRTSVRASAFGSSIGNIFRKIFGAGNLNLNIAQYNQRVLKAVGYDVAIAKNLFLDSGGIVITSPGLIASSIPGLTAGSVALSGAFGRIAFGGTSILKNLTAAGASAMIVSLTIDAIVSAVTFVGRSAYKNLWKSRSELYKIKILLSPQDDNIFPPKVEDYLVNYKPTIWKRITDGGSKLGLAILNSSWGILGYSTPSVFNEDDKTKVIKHTYLKSDNRLNIYEKENYYNLQRTTIWEVFHEMSLRHPGFTYGIRKYGDGLESRMFFGRPNQKCFVNPITNKDAVLLSKLKPLLEGNQSKLTAANLSNILKRRVTEDSFEKTKLEVSEFYIKKIEEASEPFRKYHTISSEKDIISNNLRVESGNVINQVAVSYTPSGSDDQTIYQMRGLPYLSEDRINEKAVNYSNCKGLSAACRYGMGELMHGAKEMYSGEILVLGNPKIRTNDIVVLADNFLNMHGLVEVAGITHMFSYETGFVTEIKPNAVVFGNDSYMGAISTSTIAMNAHRILIEENPSIDSLMPNGVYDDAVLEKAADEAILRFFSESDSSVYNAVYSAIPGITEYSNLNTMFGNDNAYEKAKERIKAKLKESLKNNTPILLEDITKSIGVNIVSEKAQNILLKGGLATAVITGVARKSLATALIGSAASLIGSNVVVKGAESSFKSGKIGKNLFRELLMTQLEYGHLIKILPLVKDGKPLVGGGYEYIKQAQRYKEVFGNFFNPLSDALGSYVAQEKELEEYARYLGVNALDTGFSIRDVLVTVGAAGTEFFSDGLIKGRTLKLYMQSDK